MKIRYLALLVSVLLYFTSLFCGVFDLEDGDSGFIPGFVCLLFGFEKLAWYANPFYFSSLVTFSIKKDRVTLTLSALALLIALSTLQIQEMPKNEAGHMAAVIGYGSGFYLWLSSMALVLISSANIILKSKKIEQSDSVNAATRRD